MLGAHRLAGPGAVRRTTPRRAPAPVQIPINGSRGAPMLIYDKSRKVRGGAVGCIATSRLATCSGIAPQAGVPRQRRGGPALNACRARSAPGPCRACSTKSTWTLRAAPTPASSCPSSKRKDGRVARGEQAGSRRGAVLGAGPSQPCRVLAVRALTLPPCSLLNVTATLTPTWTALRESWWCRMPSCPRSRGRAGAWCAPPYGRLESSAALLFPSSQADFIVSHFTG